MPSHNFASYKPGTFATDVTNLQMQNDFFSNEDLPAFIHEYCHYIQDISTISSIFGFSLWMRDVVALTHAFSTDIGATITIPLSRDQYGEPINKYRKFYNLYCGDADQIFDLDYSLLSIKEVHTRVVDVPLDEGERKLAVNEIELNGRTGNLHFGLIAMHEMQAFYAQSMAERHFPKTTVFSVPAESLRSYPYKFGDFLFHHYEITIGLETKFLLIDMCLDTVQAPTVFLNVLERLRGTVVSNDALHRPDLFAIAQEIDRKHSIPLEEALGQILPDLKIWANQPGRKHLRTALAWYVDQVEYIYEQKSKNSPTYFSAAFCMDLKNFGLLYQDFPSPAMINGANLVRNFSRSKDARLQEIENEMHLLNFESATTFWSHRLLYDLLCSENVEQMNRNSACPLYEACDKRIEIGDDYTCKTAPWEIINNTKNIICQYGMAAHSIGLWQNKLDIRFE